MGKEMDGETGVEKLQVGARARASGPIGSSLLLPGKWHFRIIGFERKL